MKSLLPHIEHQENAHNHISQNRAADQRHRPSGHDSSLGEEEDEQEVGALWGLLNTYLISRIRPPNLKFDGRRARIQEKGGSSFVRFVFVSTNRVAGSRG